MKSNISTRIDFLLLTSVTFLRAITVCSAFTTVSGYDNSTIILIGDVYCPNTKYLGKLCLHKKTFQSLGRSDYQGSQCASVCRVRNIPFKGQTNSFFLSLAQGVYIFEENPKSIQDVFVGRPNRRICVTRLRYKVDNPETSYAQVRLIGQKKEEEKFQQIVYVNYKLDEFASLLDVMN